MRSIHLLWLCVPLFASGCTAPPTLRARYAPPGVPPTVASAFAGSPPPAASPSDLTGSATSPPASGGLLTLEQVLASTAVHFPELLAAEQDIAAAEGALLASEGGFDPSVKGGAKAKRGFYDQEVVDLQVEQPLPFLGSRVFGGYRSGSGDFAVYDGDLKTKEGGEVRLGFGLPMARGMAIDERRLAVWKARIQRDAADPILQEKRVTVVRKASQAYWKWVAAGRKVAVAGAALQLALDRQRSLEEAVALGLFGEIILVDNQRVVAERESLWIGAQRSLENATLLLALYYRGSDGGLLTPNLEQMPLEFPPLPTFADEDLPKHLRIALDNRPELAVLRHELDQAALDIELSENRMLPIVDVEVFGSQDLGAATSSFNDKDPFEVEARIKVDIPLVRRKARGELMRSRAKAVKIGHAERFQIDQIQTEVRDASSALQRARERRDWARKALELARRVEQAERDALTEGSSDLLRLNLRENSTVSTESSLIDLEAACFAALADYRAALGLPLAPTPPRE